MQHETVIEAFVAATRRPQQLFIAALIQHLTISARDHYDSAEAATKLSLANEAIHRLAGHLRTILESDAPIEDWRIAQIDNLLSQLHPANLARLAETLRD